MVIQISGLTTPTWTSSTTAKWIDYSTLKIDKGDDFLSMVFKSRQFDNERDNKEMNAPTDKQKWVRNFCIVSLLDLHTVYGSDSVNLNNVWFTFALVHVPAAGKRILPSKP